MYLIRMSYGFFLILTNCHSLNWNHKRYKVLYVNMVRTVRTISVHEYLYVIHLHLTCYKSINEK